MKKSVVQTTVEKIDQLIEIKSKQIELLEELRTNLLAEKSVGLKIPKRRKKDDGVEKPQTED